MFWIIAASMATLAVGLLGVPLLRTSTSTNTPSRALASGTSRDLVAAVLIIAGLPTVAMLVYVAIGNPRGLASIRNEVPMAIAEPAISSAGLARLAAQLVETLKRNPDDAVKWRMLGSVYAASSRPTPAAEAYARAAALSPGDPQLLVEYAEAEAQLNGGNLHGKPVEILVAALKVDPNHQRALALAGSAAFNDGDFQGAMNHWQRLLESLSPDSDIARMVAGRVSEAREKIRSSANPPVSARGGS